MKEPIEELLEWLEEFDNLPIKPTYRNMVEKIWQIKSRVISKGQKQG